MKTLRICFAVFACLLLGGCGFLEHLEDLGTHFEDIDDGEVTVTFNHAIRLIPSTQEFVVVNAKYPYIEVHSGGAMAQDKAMVAYVGKVRSIEEINPKMYNSRDLIYSDKWEIREDGGYIITMKAFTDFHYKYQYVVTLKTNIDEENNAIKITYYVYRDTTKY